ncbi:unnamed protein product [Urochloa decumbens]|uniref:NB-ARC domain-containing protein n=1 Tax=Urochloa decumbens TaxID=240449 RepID=A0ABC9ANS8_9POAL
MPVYASTISLEMPVYASMIRFLQAELESMKGALEKVSNTPAEQLVIQDKIWARDLRELSYDIEDNIDTFMVRVKGNEQAKLQGMKKFIDRSVGLIRKAKIRRGIAAEIKDIKIRVEEVAKRHDRCALPDNEVGYTIITTTRKSDVAEFAGVAYKLRPLSLNNSRKLLYTRIFGSKNKEKSEVEEEKCPDEQLAEVSEKILNNCVGVPLAFITMASLLACKARNKMEWYDVYNSIGAGLKNNMDVKNIRKILYYELPCHLRTCLLYLSMFPEDFEIDKDCLMSVWVAEGFIQYENSGRSLFELGESYFNELINRSMIQPAYNFEEIIDGCHIHDMVLDLIRSLSSEENFVTVLTDIDGTSPPNKIRRLSLQNGIESHVMAQATRNFQHARSVVIFPYVVAQVPAPGSYRVLHVLEVNGCNLSQANSLKGLGNLYHLRYLGLRWTNIAQVPEEIGNLQFLQTLDVRRNHISSVPSSIARLRNLMCLYIDGSTRVSNGIGKLTCPEQLSWLHIDSCTANIIEELGQLTKLRRLRILLDEWNNKMLKCLGKLKKIEDLEIIGNSCERSIGALDSWVAPRHLRDLRTRRTCWFSALPAWVNPSLLVNLTYLDICVRELHQVDLEILGRLPVLRCLCLEVDNMNLGVLHAFVVGAGSFPCLVSCTLRTFVWPVLFQHGAMPRLSVIQFLWFYVMRESVVACCGGGLNLGLGNLPSLQSVHAHLLPEGASKEEAKNVAAALRHAAEMHPNNPRHDIIID